MVTSKVSLTSSALIAKTRTFPSPRLASRKKTAFLWGMMVFSLIFYFLLPIGAGYFQALFSVKVWGPVNVGILFALSEFVVAWAIAYYYARRANQVYDPMAAAIVADATRKMGGVK